MIILSSNTIKLNKKVDETISCIAFIEYLIIWYSLKDLLTLYQPK
jgi:hypothetical protein